MATTTKKKTAAKKTTATATTTATTTEATTTATTATTETATATTATVTTTKSATSAMVKKVKATVSVPKTPSLATLKTNGFSCDSRADGSILVKNITTALQGRILLVIRKDGKYDLYHNERSLAENRPFLSGKNGFINFEKKTFNLA